MPASAEIREWLERSLDADHLYGPLKRRMLCCDPYSSFDGQSPTTLVAHILSAAAVEASDSLLKSVLLPLARVLAMERRELFEYRRNTRLVVLGPVSSWNEQQAIKLLLKFARSKSKSAEPLLAALRERTTMFLVGRSLTTEELACSDGNAAFTIDVGRCDSTTGKRVEEGRVLLARPLPAFSPLLRIPANELFNVDNAMKFSAFFKMIREAFAEADVDDESLLLLTLVFEVFVVGRERSHWSRLVDGMPSAFHIVPTFWPHDDLAELDGCGVLDEVFAKRERLEAFTAQVQALLASLNEPQHQALVATHLSSIGIEVAALCGAFREANIHWARAAMDSRAFYLNYGSSSSGALREGAERILLTMAPTADMLNHDLKTMVLTRRIDESDGSFLLETGPELDGTFVGREVFMSYGPLQSWELLLSYGFVLEGDNENDRFPFPIVIDDEADDEWAIARREIRALHLLTAPSELFLCRDGRPSPCLEALLRLEHAEGADYPGLRDDPFAPCTASPEVERRINDTIESGVLAVLRSYPTTLEEDVALLEKHRSGAAPLARNRLNAVRVRAGIKELAHRAIVQCRQRRKADGGNDDVQ